MSQTIIVRWVGFSTSNISRDNVSNTYCFFDPTSGSLTGVDNPLDMVEDLYCTTPSGGSSAIGAWINGTIKRAARLDVYDLGDPSPRSPIATRQITMPSVIGSSSTLPAEVALAASFQGERVSGSAQSRRRGRVFLGPLAHQGPDHTVPNNSLLTAVQKSFKAMKDASDASLDWQWRIRSPTNSNSVLIDNGWVDNAWDTQRRRGPRATARTVWS